MSYKCMGNTYTKTLVKSRITNIYTLLIYKFWRDSTTKYLIWPKTLHTSQMTQFSTKIFKNIWFDLIWSKIFDSTQNFRFEKDIQFDPKIDFPHQKLIPIWLDYIWLDHINSFWSIFDRWDLTNFQARPIENVIFKIRFWPERGPRIVFLPLWRSEINTP